MANVCRHILRFVTVPDSDRPPLFIGQLWTERKQSVFRFDVVHYKCNRCFGFRLTGSALSRRNSSFPFEFHFSLRSMLTFSFCEDRRWLDGFHNGSELGYFLDDRHLFRQLRLWRQFTFVLVRWETREVYSIASLSFVVESKHENRNLVCKKTLFFCLET